MKFLNSDHVFCIGAHPDDVEYGMAGTFEKCWKTQFTIMVMSDGGDFDKTTTAVDRGSENQVVWDMFDNVSGYIGTTYVKDQSEDEMINLIESNLHPHFDVVVTTAHEDSHFEHRIINNLGSALCRRSPLTLVEFRSPSTLNHWIPNHFVNLTEKQYNKKKLALKKFKSQQDAAYFNVNTIDSFHRNFLCSKKGFDIVESYRIVESFQK
jgi:LmbE family N-acetylglucosaminyl deacetylase